MHLAISIIIAFFGAAIGSGMNALAYRSEAGQSWRGRSCCPHCQTQLSWWELVPLISFWLLRSRCRHCGKGISFQYFLAELSMAGLFLLSYLFFGLTVGLVISLLAVSLLLFMYIYDGRTMLITNWSVWSFNGLAFAALFLNLFQPLTDLGWEVFQLPTIWGLAAGPLIALPIFLLWLFSRGRAMGFGDVKLVLGMGWLTGIAAGFSVLTFAFWIGAAVSLGVLAGQRLWKTGSLKMDKQYTMKSAVPFGPFLILGWLLVFFSNITLF